MEELYDVEHLFARRAKQRFATTLVNPEKDTKAYKMYVLIRYMIVMMQLYIMSPPWCLDVFSMVRLQIRHGRIDRCWKEAVGFQQKLGTPFILFFEVFWARAIKQCKMGAFQQPMT